MNSTSLDVKLSTFFISGIYDLHELRHLKAANEGNILSLNDSNIRQLSPQFHNFEHLQDRNIKFYVFAGGNESEKFKQQSENFAVTALKDQRLVTFKLLSEIDHFSIVEKLLEVDYEITRLIIENSS